MMEQNSVLNVDIKLECIPRSARKYKTHRHLESHMDTTTLLIILLVLLLLGGGWYGRGRWFGR